MLLTNNLRKYVKSLHQNKFRQKYNKFIAEGPKITFEFINSEHYNIDSLICTSEWHQQNENLIKKLDGKTYVCKTKDLKTISNLQNPNNTLIVCDIPEPLNINHIDRSNEDYWVLYLDRLQDPGNMGTIIRIADWYGIDAIVSTADSVSYYNPKVVQSAMGGHNRVKLYVSEPEDMPFDKFNTVALSLNGENINAFKKADKSNLLVVGNESKGVRAEILNQSAQKLHIPKIGGAESLNAAVACGIACHQLIQGSGK